MADYVLTYAVGNVGRDPEMSTANNGSQVVSFSLAQAVQFGKDAPDPTWFNVAVWDAGLQKIVMNKIKKGSRVAVAGKLKMNESGGKTYRNLQAYRIGVVDFLFPLDSTPSAPSGPRQAPDADDDLPF